MCSYAGCLSHVLALRQQRVTAWKSRRLDLALQIIGAHVLQGLDIRGQRIQSAGEIKAGRVALLHSASRPYLKQPLPVLMTNRMVIFCLLLWGNEHRFVFTSSRPHNSTYTCTLPQQILLGASCLFPTRGSGSQGKRKRKACIAHVSSLETIDYTVRQSSVTCVAQLSNHALTCSVLTLACKVCVIVQCYVIQGYVN